MVVARYISHPEVVVDAGVAVDRWVLSELGVLRLARLCEAPWVATIGRIVCSSEAKAKQTATALAEHQGVPIEVRPDIGEIDRSATGFLPVARHEAVADVCFARPTASIEGWERAVDAQRRIVEALADLFLHDQTCDVAVVGHGGVGTLWYCHVAGLPIERCWDQPGQGHYFSVDLHTHPAPPLAPIRGHPVTSLALARLDLRSHGTPGIDFSPAHRRRLWVDRRREATAAPSRLHVCEPVFDGVAVEAGQCGRSIRHHPSRIRQRVHGTTRRGLRPSTTTPTR